MIADFFRTYINALLSPTSLIGFILLTGVIFLWTKEERLARAFLTTGTILFVLVSLSPLRFGMYSMLESENFDIGGQYEYVVVLGTKAYPRGDHPISSQLSPSLMARLVEGVRLVNENPASFLVVTGNGGGKIPEAELMQKTAMALGVPLERIIVENKSMSTDEHPVYLAPILKDHDFVLVTSAFHMDRALNDFRSHGLNPKPFSTDFINKSENPFELENLIMRGENFSALDRWVAELYSRLWTFIKRPSDKA